MKLEKKSWFSSNCILCLDSQLCITSCLNLWLSCLPSLPERTTNANMLRNAFCAPGLQGDWQHSGRVDGQPVLQLNAWQFTADRKKWTQTMQRFAKGDRNAQQEISKQAVVHGRLKRQVISATDSQLPAFLIRGVSKQKWEIATKMGPPWNRTGIFFQASNCEMATPVSTGAKSPWWTASSTSCHPGQGGAWRKLRPSHFGTAELGNLGFHSQFNGPLFVAVWGSTDFHSKWFHCNDETLCNQASCRVDILFAWLLNMKAIDARNPSIMAFHVSKSSMKLSPVRLAASRHPASHNTTGGQRLGLWSGGSERRGAKSGKRS